MLHNRQAPGRDFHKHFSLAPARSDTEGGQAKNIDFLAILHIFDARGHNSTKAT